MVAPPPTRRTAYRRTAMRMSSSASAVARTKISYAELHFITTSMYVKISLCPTKETLSTVSTLKSSACKIVQVR